MSELTIAIAFISDKLITEIRNRIVTLSWQDPNKQNIICLFGLAIFVERRKYHDCNKKGAK